MTDRIRVGIKVRPLIRREKSQRANVLWQNVSDKCIVQLDPSTGQQKGEPYVFDHVFGPDSSNKEVFEVLVKPIVESAVRGFNGTIFAYGQTASGKTYTMMGDQYEPGIIPQAVNLIFDTIENTPGREFLLRVCYMEIYNEKVNDLLCKSNRNLKVYEDPNGNFIVKDLEENITNSSQMVMDFMKKGETIRKIGETNMNEKSSRSHSIFRVIIESRMAGSDAEEAIQVSHLNLVDLAGSERAGATGSVGNQFKEGCAINTSLFILGKVISQLSEGDTYVSFRDSKLTRILQNSLGGNALTAIICAVTPAAAEETCSTLGFASRARNIKISATVNEVLSDRALLKRYVKQMARLESAISTIEEQKNAETEQLQKENLVLQERINRMKDVLLRPSSDQPETSDKVHEKLKKSRRRTWSAPNRNVSRLSLSLPFKKLSRTTSSSGRIMEESSRLSNMSTQSQDPLDESDIFLTPLEEFEKALIKAEACKSMDECDWLPPIDGLEDDQFFKSLEDDAHHLQPISYIQTRKPKSYISTNDNVDFPAPTPPSKLRAKISSMEQELDEITEYTRLEKQMFDEELMAELEIMKVQLKESQAQCESVKDELRESNAKFEFLKGVQDQLESLKLSDRTSYDYQMLLIDSSKRLSVLTDEHTETKNQLTDALAECEELEDLKKKLDALQKQLKESSQANAVLKEQGRKQEEKLFHLANEKEDFNFKLEMTVSKYESRLKDLTEALESARYELDKHQGSTQQNKFIGNLYSVEEEPTIDELALHVQYMKDENRQLQLQVSNKSSLVNELALKQDRIADLEKQLESFTDNSCLQELESLKDKNIILMQKIQEKEKHLAKTLEEIRILKEERLVSSPSCIDKEDKPISLDSRYIGIMERLVQCEQEISEAKYMLLEHCDDSDSNNALPLSSIILEFLDVLKNAHEKCDELSNVANVKEQLQEEVESLNVVRQDLEEKLESKNSIAEVKEELKTVCENGEETFQILIDSEDHMTSSPDHKCLEELESLKEKNINLLQEIQEKEKCLSETLEEIRILKEERLVSSPLCTDKNDEPINLDTTNETTKERLTQCEEEIEKSKSMLLEHCDDFDSNNAQTLVSIILKFLDVLKNAHEKCDELSNVANVKEQLQEEVESLNVVRQDLEVKLESENSIAEVKEGLKTVCENGEETSQILIDSEDHMTSSSDHKCVEELESLKDKITNLLQEIQDKEKRLSETLEEIRILKEERLVSSPLCTDKNDEPINLDTTNETTKERLTQCEEEIEKSKSMLLEHCEDFDSNNAQPLSSIILEFLDVLKNAHEKCFELSNVANEKVQLQEEVESLNVVRQDLEEKLESKNSIAEVKGELKTVCENGEKSTQILMDGEDQMAPSPDHSCLQELNSLKDKNINLLQEIQDKEKRLSETLEEIRIIKEETLVSSPLCTNKNDEPINLHTTIETTKERLTQCEEEIAKSKNMLLEHFDDFDSNNALPLSSIILEFLDVLKNANKKCVELSNVANEKAQLQEEVESLNVVRQDLEEKLESKNSIAEVKEGLKTVCENSEETSQILIDSEDHMTSSPDHKWLEELECLKDKNTNLLQEIQEKEKHLAKTLEEIRILKEERLVSSPLCTDTNGEPINLDTTNETTKERLTQCEEEIEKSKNMLLEHCDDSDSNNALPLSSIILEFLGVLKNAHEKCDELSNVANEKAQLQEEVESLNVVRQNLEEKLESKNSIAEVKEGLKTVCENGEETSQILIDSEDHMTPSPDHKCLEELESLKDKNTNLLQEIQDKEKRLSEALEEIRILKEERLVLSPLCTDKNDEPINLATTNETTKERLTQCEEEIEKSKNMLLEHCDDFDSNNAQPLSSIILEFLDVLKNAHEKCDELSNVANEKEQLQEEVESLNVVRQDLEEKLESKNSIAAVKEVLKTICENGEETFQILIDSEDHLTSSPEHKCLEELESLKEKNLNLLQEIYDMEQHLAETLEEISTLKEERLVSSLLCTNRIHESLSLDSRCEEQITERLMQCEEEILEAKNMLLKQVDNSSFNIGLRLSSFISELLNVLKNANEKCDELGNVANEKEQLQVEVESLKIVRQDLEEKLESKNSNAEVKEGLKTVCENGEETSQILIDSEDHMTSSPDHKCLEELESLKDKNTNLLQEIQDKEKCLSEALEEIRILKEERLVSSPLCTDKNDEPINIDTTNETTKERLTQCEEEIAKAKNMLLEHCDDFDSNNSMPLSSIISEFLSIVKNTNEKCVELALAVHEKEQLQQEVEVLKVVKHDLEEKLESKDSIILGVKQELKTICENGQQSLQILMGTEICEGCSALKAEVASATKLLCDGLENSEHYHSLPLASLVPKILSSFQNVNEKYAILEREVVIEKMSRKSAEEESAVLRKQCLGLEDEVKSAQSTLAAEVKSISGNIDVVDMPLSSLITEFLTSVMKAQKRVASVLMEDIQTCNDKLEASQLRVNKYQEQIQELKAKIKQMELALEDSRAQNINYSRSLEEMECLLKTLQSLFGLSDETMQCDGLTLTIKDKLNELIKKCDKFEQLQASAHQQGKKVSELEQLNANLKDELVVKTGSIETLEKTLAEINVHLKSVTWDLTEKKEIISKLEELICDSKLLLKEKDNEIHSVRKSLENYEAEIEYLKQIQQEAVKSSRDGRSRQRKLQAEVSRLKAELDAFNVAPMPQDVMVVQEKDEIIKGLQAKLSECQLQCKEQTEKISELDNERKHLDDECNELLSWGRSIESNLGQLADRLTGVLKDLCETKKKLVLIGTDHILFLRSSSKEITRSLNKIDGEQLEMQLSSKEKAAKNAKLRIEEIASRIQVSSSHNDTDSLQSLCVELDQENEVISNLNEESLCIWNKILEVQKDHSGSLEFLKRGYQQEAKPIVSTKMVDCLKGKLNTHESTNTHSSLKTKYDSGDLLSNGQNCQSEEMKVHIQTLRKDLADKNAEIANLKIMQEIQRKPAEDKIQQLQEKLKIFRDENNSLKTDYRRIMTGYQETTVCEASRQVKMKNVQTQTTESTDEIYKSLYWSGAPSGIVEENNRIILQSKVRRLEQEKEAYKRLCIERKNRCDKVEKELQQLLKDGRK